jgi:hypothetical protein
MPQCVRPLQQGCKAPMRLGIGGLHGGGSYERHGLTLVTTLGGARRCACRWPPWWRARGSTCCFDNISKRRFCRVSLVVVLLVGGSPCWLCEFSCTVLGCLHGDVTHS